VVADTFFFFTFFSSSLLCFDSVGEEEEESVDFIRFSALVHSLPSTQTLDNGTEHTREMICENTHTTHTHKRRKNKFWDERHFESRRDERESFTAKQNLLF
jgi:hypothetical protein